MNNFIKLAFKNVFRQKKRSFTLGVNYAVVAFILVLLLAFSEHIGFDAAFGVAAVAAVGQIGLYAGAVFGSKAYAIRALAVFAGVYVLLYVLMRLEDYALVVGAIASFVAIALTMWMTRNVDWYGGAQASEGSALKGA